MNVQKKNIGLNNGWILCPSKSFPGKFYYFNVLNGEAAWSLNEADKKDVRKENTIHRVADKSHSYPEPNTLPDDTSILSCKVGASFNQPDHCKSIPLNQPLPIFGQSVFNKNVGNVGPLMPNIVWTPVQMPMPMQMPMFCQESKKPMSDKITQTSEFERNLFIQACEIPLCKRFKNYEKPLLNFDEKNKIVNKPENIFQTSTPKKPECQTISKSKSLIKEPVLKLEPKLPAMKMPEVKDSTGKSTFTSSTKIENAMTDNGPKIVQGEEVLKNLDRTDLRFLLLARKRKSKVVMTDAAVGSKRSRANEVTHITQKKKVTFDLAGQSEDSSVMEDDVQEDFIPITPNHNSTPKTPIFKDKSQTPCMNAFMNVPKDLATWRKQTAMSVVASRNDVWYIVADTDVLLLDYESIDQLVLSDNKCKLLIPNAVRIDIEGLCIGDCRGQQRVINARQLTRRLASPPRHYIVERVPDDRDNMLVSTESILNCCIKAIKDNYYVVLITNDPHLLYIAKSRNIPSYKLNEIKNGVDIKPEMTSERKFQFQNSIDDTDNYNTFQNDTTNKNDNTFGLFSDLNNVASPIDTMKKQVFLNHSDTVTHNVLDCDKLINITRPNSMNNITKYDSDSTTTDISCQVKKINLKDNSILSPKNKNRNPFLPQSMQKAIKEDGFVNFEKNIQNSNTTFNGFNFGNWIPKPKVDVDFENSISTQLNHDIHNFQKTADGTKKLFCSTPIPSLKSTKIPNSHFETGVSNKMPNISVLLPHDPHGTSSENRILSATFTSINNTTANNQQESKKQKKTEDSNGLFKVPQPVQFKNRTKNTSGLVKRAPTTDQIGRFQKTNSIDEILKSFRVKSKIVSQTISSRIDEWICSFTQIMEDVLNNMLQKNSECMKNTVAPVTLHDTLNCIKLLYDSHTKIREVVNHLEELLSKCLCMKGKLKSSLRPDDFMKMLGYGVLLVLSLENIQPLSDDLKEAKSCLSDLLHTIENTSTDLDPYLFKTLVVSRSDGESEDGEIRPTFVKEPSYVLDYLKKHFKEWANCSTDLDTHHTNKPQYHSDFTVVRTNGKNLNLLKINSTKTICLTKKMVEESCALKSKDDPKVRTLLDNNQQNKNNHVNIDTIEKKKAGPKLTKLVQNDQNIFMINNNNTVIEKSDMNNFIKENELIGLEKDVPKLTKTIVNIDQDAGNETKMNENQEFPTHGNTFTQIEETGGPKMIRNIKLIDEYELKIKNREPLDLDLLDYSEIYDEPSVAGNLDFDVLSENTETDIKKNCENVENDNDNYGLSNKMCILEDFTEDVNLGDHKDFYAIPTFDYESEKNKYTFKTKTNDTDHKTNTENRHKHNYYDLKDGDSVANINFSEKPENTNCVDRKNINDLSRNDSCIDIDNSDTRYDNSAIHNDNSDPHYANSKQHNVKFDKSSPIVGDDTTNDSGFENDSTYAHSVVKLFLNELTTSFIVIYQFVTQFVNEIRDSELCELRKNIVHNQASKSLEDMVAIIELLRSIIKRESAEDTVLKTLLLKAGVEATTDKRITRYRQIVMKSLEQAQILENALKIIVSITIGDFDAMSINADSISSSIRYFNIFE